VLGVLGYGLCALAGSATSGGGGAYVCRDGSGQIKSAQLVDLWESQNIPFEWSSAGATTIDVSLDNQTSVDQQITKAMGRLARLDSGLATQVGIDLKAIQGAVRPLPDGVSLTIPNDLKVDYFPTGCPPERNDEIQQLDVRLGCPRDIFSKLATKTDVAAAFMHEAIGPMRPTVVLGFTG